MRISYYPPAFDHERRFLAEFLTTAEHLGHRVVMAPEDADLHVQWGVHHKALTLPTIYVELGWLPRWWYQVSHTGINAQHHLARPQLEPLSAEREWKADCLLKNARHGMGAPRHGWGYIAPMAGPPDDVPERYVLAALQMETDINMGAVPEACRTNQGFVNVVTEDATRHQPGLPIIFKQHPHSRAAMQLDLTVHRDDDRIYPHKHCMVYGYLSDPRCVAVVVANSNVAHDALIYDKPTVAYGDGVWPRGMFLPSLRYLPDWPAGDRLRAQYVYWLGKAQWRLEDARDPQRVDAAIEGAMG